MHVYIIYSSTLDSYYIGFCQHEVEKRLELHVTGFYDNSYTKKASDWKLVWSITCDNNKQALDIEKHIKKMKSILKK